MRRPSAVRRSAALATLVLLVCVAGTEGTLAATSTSATGYDWTTYGFHLSRDGFNPAETTLTSANADSLALRWSADLGAVSITQPVVASGVAHDGTTSDVVYVGGEDGLVHAFDADTGGAVWSRDTGHVTSACQDLPGGVYGVSGTPVIDRSRNLLYVAGGDARIYALDLGTGAIKAGWPVTVDPDPVHNHVWGALTQAGNALFVVTAGLCDIRPYHGRIVKIDIPTAAIVATWWPTGAPPSPDGGGIWGYGGLAAVPSAKRVYAATGNGFPESTGYSERVVSLTTGLAVTASNFPGLHGVDVDFGSTPLLFTPPGCAPMLLASNKTGELVLYKRTDIGAGPLQHIRIARAGSGWMVIGVAGYSPQTGLVYVTNPGKGAGAYRNGLLAFRTTSGCRLSLAWQRTAGPNGETTVSSPTIAGGVVYYGDGAASHVRAIDAATGLPLWNSGSEIVDAIYGAPSVANGKLYVVAWDGKLRCFAPA